MRLPFAQTGRQLKAPDPATPRSDGPGSAADAAMAAGTSAGAARQPDAAREDRVRARTGLVGGPKKGCEKPVLRHHTALPLGAMASLDRGHGEHNFARPGQRDRSRSTLHGNAINTS